MRIATSEVWQYAADWEHDPFAHHIVYGALNTLLRGHFGSPYDWLRCEDRSDKEQVYDNWVEAKPLKLIHCYV